MIWNYKKGFGVGFGIGLVLTAIYFGFSSYNLVIFLIGSTLNNIGMGTVLILPFVRLFKSRISIISDGMEGGFLGAGVVLAAVDVIQHGLPFPPPSSSGLITGFSIGDSTMWASLAAFLTALLTLGTLVILIRQTKILQKQSRLAYGPVIIPRFIFNNIDNKIHIHLFNVGKGHALDINLQFKDSNDNPIGRKEIRAYALLSVEVESYNSVLGQAYPEQIDTGISFVDKYEFKITGWYRDAYDDKITADRTYEYPPKFV